MEKFKSLDEIIKEAREQFDSYEYAETLIRDAHALGKQEAVEKCIEIANKHKSLLIARQDTNDLRGALTFDDATDEMEDLLQAAVEKDV